LTAFGSFYRCMKKDILKNIEKNFGFWLLLMAVVGYLYPQLFVWGESITDKLLMFSFFLGCIRINFDEALHLRSNYGKLILFAMLNLVLIPLLLFAVTPFINVDTRTGLFLIMAASGGMLTPLIASFLGLNILWAVVYTILSSALVPFTLPLLVRLVLGIETNADSFEMILFLAKIVFPPAILAYLFRRFLSDFTTKLTRFSGTLGSINMSFFVAIIIAVNHPFLQQTLFRWSTLPVLLMLILVFIIRYFIGYYMPYQDKRERWTNALLFGVMNNGLIILFSTQYFSQQVIFVALMSEIPWILAQPVFQRVHQRYYSPEKSVQ
jgi:bile acid:Na+ symporter, BASS family